MALLSRVFIEVFVSIKAESDETVLVRALRKPWLLTNC